MNLGGLRIEKRLKQRRWLIVAVPLGSLVVAHIAIAILLMATGHPPITTLRRLFDAAYLANGALTNTLIAATPLAFTGLAAAVAFRMRLFNIGAEGQLYFGAIGAAGMGLLLAGQSTTVLIVGHGRRRRRARSRVGRDPGPAAGVPAYQRDHHLADAQLRRRARPQLPDLRQPLVLARHVAAGARLPAGQGARRCGDLAGDDDRLDRDPARVRSRSSGRGRDLGAELAHALRLRGAGDRRLAARCALRRHADAPQDRRRDGTLGRDRRHRRREPDRRLPPHARCPRAAAVELRLYRHRRGGARPLQPVRGGARRVPARRARERGLHAAERRLPVRPRRRDAGTDPVRDARRRAARAVPGHVRPLRAPAQAPAGQAR